MLKNKPYTRHVVILFIYIGMWILNFFISPTLYILGRTKPLINRAKRGRANFWCWFINIDEPSIIENMYGDDKYRKRKGIFDILNRNFFVRFYWFWRWNVERNSFFYFKLHVIKPIPLPVNRWKILVLKNTTGKPDLHWCSWDDRGTIHIEYPIGYEQYFRYSQTKEVKYLFWSFIRKIQFGASGIEDKNRYIYKINHRRL